MCSLIDHAQSTEALELELEPTGRLDTVPQDLEQELAEFSSEIGCAVSSHGSSHRELEEAVRADRADEERALAREQKARGKD